MCAQAAAASQPSKKKKGPAVQLNFSELDDLFLNTKGKALRNLRKKLDKYNELAKSQRQGALQPNPQQLEQIQSIPSIKTEIEDLEALCKLYMESNPGFSDKKNAAPALTQDDITSAVNSAFNLVGQVSTLSALIQEDSSLVEASEAERASLDFISQTFTKMLQEASTGSKALQKDAARSIFASNFTKLARASADHVKEAGVSFADLNSFVNRCFTDNAQIVQRIADKALAEKRAAQASADAAKKAAREEKAAAEAQAAKAAETTAASQAHAEPAQTAPEEETKGTSEVTTTQGESYQEGDSTAVQGERGGRGGRRGRGDRGDRGDRGGRGGDRGDRGDRRGRGDRGGRGRGGFNKPREDEDGFVMETGEKPKPRRENYRGRRGERGDFRGGRGDRGDRRGGDRGGDWEKRGGRGGRPQTEGGAENSAAAQEQQPAAQVTGAQASTNGQSEV